MVTGHHGVVHVHSYTVRPGKADDGTLSARRGFHTVVARRPVSSRSRSGSPRVNMQHSSSQAELCTALVRTDSPMKAVYGPCPSMSKGKPTGRPSPMNCPAPPEPVSSFLPLGLALRRSTPETQPGAGQEGQMGREESTCRWEKAVKANQQSQRPDLNAGRRRRHPAPIFRNMCTRAASSEQSTW